MNRLAMHLLLAAILVLILAGCGESNPLIGEWKDSSDEAAELEVDGVVLIIQFTKSSMIMGEPGNAAHFGVEYEVFDDYVLVMSDSGNEIKVDIEDKNHISMDTPHGRAYLERQ